MERARTLTYHGRTARYGRPGPAVEVIDRPGSHHLQVHVGVRIDAAGNDELSGRIYGPRASGDD
jgi:hypothetical protein